MTVRLRSEKGAVLGSLIGGHVQTDGTSSPPQGLENLLHNTFWEAIGFAYAQQQIATDWITI
ncbi:MAG: hypothetical protein M3O46_16750 [Myxococcota bacterium]|nr:hypothetical protein [Myxococcota bacterium]